MKIASIVKIGVCSLFALMLVSCADYQDPTTRFGTGEYRCYYHDERNGQFYLGTSTEQADAVRNARDNCLQAPPKDLEHEYCKFADCVFK